MSLIEVATLFATMVTLAALPSASVALVITRSVTLGVKNGIAVAFGIVLGDLVFVVLAVLGLSVVAETMGGLFTLLKVVGGMYLIWLGISLWRSQGEMASLTPKSDQNIRGLATSFISGFVLTLGDIKAIFFYASLFPIFVDLSSLVFLDLAKIIAIIIFGVGGVKVLYAVFATKAGYFLKRKKLQKISQKVAGSLMIGVGSYLVLQA